MILFPLTERDKWEEKGGGREKYVSKFEMQHITKTKQQSCTQRN